MVFLVFFFKNIECSRILCFIQDDCVSFMMSASFNMSGGSVYVHLK